MSVIRSADQGPYACPCCGCITLRNLGLTEARANFQRIGAFEERLLPRVRVPTDAERPPAL